MQNKLSIHITCFGVSDGNEIILLQGTICEYRILVLLTAQRDMDHRHKTGTESPHSSDVWFHISDKIVRLCLSHRRKIPEVISHVDLFHFT